MGYYDSNPSDSFRSGRPLPPPPPEPPARRTAVGPYYFLILVGVILLIIGYLIGNIGGYYGEPVLDDYTGDDAQDDFDEDKADWQSTLRTLTTTANLIAHLGLLLMAMGIIIGAIKDDGLPPMVRLGMLIMLGLLLSIKGAGIV